MRRGRIITAATLPIVLACSAAVRSAYGESPFPHGISAPVAASDANVQDMGTEPLAPPDAAALLGAQSSAPVELTLAPPPPRRRPPSPGDAGAGAGAGAGEATTSTTAPSGAAADEPRVLPMPPGNELRLAYPPATPRPFGAALGTTPQLGRNDNYLPIPDRWRIGLPDAYVQNQRGNILNPYRQNALKGDYPVFGTQDIFFVLGLTSDTLYEARRLPTPSGVSSRFPNRFAFFGRGESDLLSQNFIISAELFKGNASYQPKDWSVKATAVYNINYLHTEELGITNPDVGRLHDRTDNQFAFQELFVEKKLADLSANFDFASVRVGVQGFSSDFRGFLFADNEPGIRLFGNFDNNRWQYNLAVFNQVEKDTNSGLNTFDARNQQIIIANLYRQDFIFPGYTAQLSFHGNFDQSGTQYDTNGFLVRPEPFGTIANKNVNAYYLGWAGDGHIGRLNITHQFYYVLGDESFNEIAGRHVEIGAEFFALELSYDQDYIRYRASFVYASGDHNPTDGHAGGFDTIFDNPNFAGGGISFFTRQAIALTGAGVNLVQRNSFVPDLRTTKEQGQANFVNPGLLLYNVGMDIDITPKIKLITNASYLRFDDTSSLRLLLQDNKIGRDIGFDISAGIEYRPLLNNNVILTFGAAALIPGEGFQDIYTSQTLYSTFVAATFTY